MRKIFLLSSLSLLLAQGLGAQYVTIPDANFRARLMQELPNCFNALQQLDTTCAAIGSLTFLNLNNANISNLDGLQYLDALQRLLCPSNQLTSLPLLHNSLTHLYCFNNQLTSLPAMSNSLQELDCSNNQLTSLPALPNSLYYFKCYSNQLTSLPNLPTSLNNLHCYLNQLTSLPALPNSLTLLHCSNNYLTSLPMLPNSLQHLYCYNNPFLSCLPLLPAGLQSIQCNQTAIPCLPNNNNFLTAGTAAVNFLPLCTDPNQICPPDPLAIENIYQVPGGAPLTVRVFPNPAEQSTHFALDAPLAGPATLTLFNALGQAVRGLELPAGALGAELQRDGLPAGLYFFELADGGALRVAGRLLWR